MSDRARQFAPFSALKGFHELAKEKERIVTVKRELSEDSQKELSDKILLVRKGMMVKLVYFENGEYISLEGMVSGIDLVFRTITVVKKRIEFDNIFELEIKE